MISEGATPDGLRDSPGVKRPAAIRSWRLPLALLLLLQVLSYARMAGPEFLFSIHNHDDTESYLALGRALSLDLGYTRSLDPAFYVPHRHFPPVLPALIASIFRFSDSMLGPQLLIMAFALANTLLLYVLARRFVRPSLALLTTAWTVLSPLYGTLAVVVMAEQPLVFFTLISVLALDRWTRAGWHWDRWALLAAGAMAVGVLVKGILLAAAPALLAFALLGSGPWSVRRRRLLRASGLVVLALLPWLAWGARCLVTPAIGYEGLLHMEEIETGRMSAEHARGLVERLILMRRILTGSVPYRAADIFGGAGWMLQTYSSHPLGLLPRAALLLFLAGLLARSLRNFGTTGLAGLIAAATIGLLLTFHAGGAARYWLSVLPILTLLLMAQVEGWLLRRKNRGSPTRGVMIASFVAALTTVGGLFLLEQLQRRPQFGGPWADFVQSGQELRRRSDATAVVLGHNLLALQLISRRYAALSEDDWRGLKNETAMRRQVFVVEPDPRSEVRRPVTIGWPGNFLGDQGSSLTPADLPGEKLEIWRNGSYRILQLRPAEVPAPDGNGGLRLDSQGSIRSSVRARPN